MSLGIHGRKQGGIDNTFFRLGRREYNIHVKNKKALEDVKVALERYREMDINFPGSREDSLIENVIKAYEDKDVDEFTDALREYDRIRKFDNWQTTLLLRVKNTMAGPVGEDDENADLR